MRSRATYLSHQLLPRPSSLRIHEVPLPVHRALSSHNTFCVRFSLIQILEKHFTHDKNLPGNDHYHSMDMDDLEKFNFILNQIDKKSKNKIPTDRKVLSCEKKSRKYARRSLYSQGKINKGDKFDRTNIIAKRPGYGISPIYFKKLIGKESKVFIDNDELISFSKHVKNVVCFVIVGQYFVYFANK